jgi:hypothetical protein
LLELLRDIPPGSPAGAIRNKLQQRRVLPAAGEVADLERKLCEALNALLLERDNLFDYALLERDAEARLIAELFAAKASNRPAPDEQVQLNRLMLEAVFPEAVVTVDTRQLTLLFDALRNLPGAEPTHTALCLSGGGIRSAAFSLGVVQQLARCGVLDKFDYLSTVSGGGYTGSWLSSWAHRRPQGLSGVVQALNTPARRKPGNSGAKASAALAGAGTDNFTAKINPAPAPVAFLRSYSHFLNARAGLFTADTWTWIGIYLRNLTLNWMVIIPFLLLLLAMPRLYVASLHAWFPSTATPGVLASLAWLSWLAWAGAVLTLVCVTVNRPSVTDPAHLRPTAVEKAAHSALNQQLESFKHQHWILLLGVLPMFVFAMPLTLMVWGLPGANASELYPSTPFIGDWLAPLVSRLAHMLSSVAPGAAETLAHVPRWLWQMLSFVLSGEAVVLVAWLISFVLLVGRSSGHRVRELFAMLIAGLPTWVALGFIAAVATRLLDNDTRFSLLSFGAYPTHVYAVLAVPVVAMVVLAGMTLFIGLVSKWKFIEDADREWWGRFGAWVLIGVVGWTVLSAVVIFGPPLLMEFPRLIAAVGGVSGMIAILLGKSSLTSATGQKGAAASQNRNVIRDLLGINTLAMMSAVFLLVFLAFLSLLSSGLVKPLVDALIAGHGSATSDLARYLHYLLPADFQLKQTCGANEVWPYLQRVSVFHDAQVHLRLVCQTPWQIVGMVMAVLLALLLGFSVVINLNKFSLHAAYRMRIVRSFLGASRDKLRRPNPFTGFDQLDDVQMHELQPGLLREADIKNLAGFVENLQASLKADAPPSVMKAIAQHICAPEHDRAAVLSGRLEAHQKGGPVAKALQQEIIEALNRMIETTPLEQLEEFAGAVAPNLQEILRYLSHGNVIFANRLLLQTALPNEINSYRLAPPPHKLMHVVNLTLNLVHGKRLAWQERKAAPFVVTPLHSGNYYLGYRKSRDYGGPEGISIGTAAAISGAAVSPNMGYSSSPLTALLLTLFNVRLGWWLGNPGIAGSDTYQREEPKFSLRPLLSEALGLTDDRSRYVYLSDGGHFENMGLFEMVLRRCQFIVCTDAGADPDYQFEDLANAVRKIRIDLGIRIEFDTMPIHRPKAADDSSGRYCARARIRYGDLDSGAPDGILILFKPVLCGKEPQDVAHYAAQNKVFPQEPTADQFFGESQFESYRMLGEHAVLTALGDDLAKDQPWTAALDKRVGSYLSVARSWTNFFTNR